MTFTRTSVCMFLILANALLQEAFTLSNQIYFTLSVVIERPPPATTSESPGEIVNLVTCEHNR